MKTICSIKSKFITLTFAILLSINTFATVYTTVSNGNWNSNSTWSPSKPNFNSNFKDTVLVNHNFNLNVTLNVYGRLVISQNASINGSSKNFTVKENSTFINNGTLNIKYFTADWGQTTVVNNGNITVHVDFANQEGSFTNNSSLTVNGLFKNNTGGIFNNSNNAVLTVNNSFVNYDTIINSGTITLADEFTNSNNSYFLNSGTFNVEEEFKNKGTFSNSGSLSVDDEIKNDNNAILINSGNIVGTDNFENQGPFNNSGTITVADDFENQAYINNSNTINVGGDFQNDVVIIDNSGTLNITNNLENAGTIHNEGAIFVDGIANSVGLIDGSGNLCNSNGATDPTNGAKGIYCVICAGEGATLPVNLIDFSATINNKIVTLSWATATEINNEHFEVLKSKNGVDFEIVAKVTGNGNSNIMLTYSANDENPTEGANYYILKQVDFDGKSSTSKIINVIMDANAVEAKIFPNPVANGSNINIEMGTTGEKTIEIYSVNGQLERNINSQNTNIEINTAEMERGIYLVRIIQNNNIITKKLQVY